MPPNQQRQSNEGFIYSNIWSKLPHQQHREFCRRATADSVLIWPKSAAAVAGRLQEWRGSHCCHQSATSQTHRPTVHREQKYSKLFVNNQNNKATEPLGIYSTMLLWTECPPSPAVITRQFQSTKHNPRRSPTGWFLPFFIHQRTPEQNSTFQHWMKTFCKPVVLVVVQPPWFY